MASSLSKSVPWISRRAFALESWATLLFSFGLSFLEAGTISVFLKQVFAGTVEPSVHNYAVAVAGSAAEIANLVSFGWISSVHGRPRVQFINKLQMGMCACLAAVSLVPVTRPGLWITVSLVLLARLCWSGILTLRTSVWRANYPREVRSRVVGRFAIITQLTVAACGYLIGASIDLNRESFRVLAPALAAVACGGLLYYARIRVRDEQRHLAEERTQPHTGSLMKPWHGFMSTIRILRGDARFAQFMAFMFVLGMGNLMVVPLLSMSLASQFDLGSHAAKTSVIVTATLPNLLMPCSVPIWAALLDRSHVVHFRSWHGWTFVIAVGFLLAGYWMHSMPLVYVGSAFWGIGLGGGSIAWNLGHTDFAPLSLNSHYMATHVTLNGVRGVLAPYLSATLFNMLTKRGVDNPGAWVLGVSLFFTFTGCLGFVWLKHSMRDVVSKPVHRTG